ncbi:MAG TPA: YcxB family protein [Terracidiphilus sp.]|jgi:uncharacterized membrane protein|nr:YcxB family protein [Terracidiphilus sp.]
MEFSYRISEQDYREAWKLRLKQGQRGPILKTIAFWVVILICLMLLYSVIQRQAQTHQAVGNSSEAIAREVQQPAAPARPVHANWEKLFVDGPFVLMAIIWVIVMINLGPKQLRRLYTNDPMMQGEFTVEISPNGLASANTAGTSSKTGWNIYDFWREGRDVIVIVLRSQAYFVISLREFSIQQREELRTILTQALPPK